MRWGRSYLNPGKAVRDAGWEGGQGLVEDGVRSNGTGQRVCGWDAGEHMVKP